MRIIHATFELFCEWKKCSDEGFTSMYPEEFNVIEEWWHRVENDEDYWLQMYFKDSKEYKEFKKNYHFIVEHIFYLWI